MKTSDADQHTRRAWLPHRRDDLQIEGLDGEAVVYDPLDGAVHRFNATTFFVWNACDGSRSANDIAAGVVEHYSVGAGEALDVVHRVIARLNEKGLLQAESSGSADEANSMKPVPACAIVDQQDRSMNAQRADTALPAAHPTEPSGQGLSRRALLGSSVTKAALAAPVISTFFAAGAYASGPSASGAFGPGGCKTVGYSCAVPADCCEEGAENTDCEDGVCCIRKGKVGCTIDDDCCSTATGGCVDGTCMP
ncbi:MAG: PqqD family protein [Phycisphaerales bacterium]|nr:MAG: PqqD family protein [Phycisphaerales bacterium]